MEARAVLPEEQAPVRLWETDSPMGARANIE